MTPASLDTASLDTASLDTPWRRLAALFFGPPRDPVITTTCEIDAEAMTAYCEEARRPGVVLRPLHFVAVAAVRTLKEDVPELNGYVRHGRVVPKREVALVVTAMLPGADDLIQLRLTEADLADAATAAERMRQAVHLHRARAQRGEAPPEYLLARMPWLVRGGVYRGLHALTHRLGLPLRRLDLAPESLGSLILSDLTRFSERLPTAHALVRDHHGALMPAGHAAGFLAMSAPRPVPTVVGDAVVPRLRFPLCGTFDHRVVDASHVGRFFAGIVRRLQDPASLDRPLTS